MRFFWQRKPRVDAREARDLWLQWLELSGFAPKTIDGYRRTTDRLLRQWPTLALDEFTSELLEEFIEQASEHSRQQRRGPLHNFFGWAFRTKRLDENPMLRVATYKAPRQEPPNVFTLAECKVLEALPSPDGALMAILLGSGIRKAEARHLTPKRIDFENGELHVVEGAKGGSVGVVALEDYVLRRIDELTTLEGLNEDDFFWYTHRGGSTQRKHDRPASDGAMHQWWVNCIAQAGVPYRNMHLTRHTFATMWRRRGLSLDDVGFQLRHADPRTTSRVYVHMRSIDVKRNMSECLSREEALS